MTLAFHELKITKSSTKSTKLTTPFIRDFKLTNTESSNRNKREQSMLKLGLFVAEQKKNNNKTKLGIRFYQSL